MVHVGLDVVQRADVGRREHVRRSGRCASTRPSRSRTSRRHSAAARFRSCVDSDHRDVPRSRLSARQQRCTSSWWPRSSDAVGSSSSSRSDSCASALAMTTRCFSPPLSVCEQPRPRTRTCPVASSACCAIARSSGPSSANAPRCGKASHQHDVEHGEVERRVRFLRHDGDAARQLAPRPVGQRPAVEGDRPGGGVSDAAQQLEQRRLAGAVRAEEADELAAIDRERHAVDAPSARRRVYANDTSTACSTARLSRGCGAVRRYPCRRSRKWPPEASRRAWWWRSFRRLSRREQRRPRRQVS